MSAQAAGRIPKPVLRGHLHTLLKRNMWIIGFAAVGAGLAWKHGVAEPRKRRYAEFYKNYDPDADADRIQGLGIFSNQIGEDRTDRQYIPKIKDDPLPYP